MVSLKSILAEARALPPAERAELINQLLQQTAQELDTDDTEAGQRGLAAWTESARDEDWAPFYPPQLRSAGRTDS